MGDLEHVGTLPLSSGAVRVRIYAPTSRKLEWFTDLDEMIAKGYSPLKVRATKAWVVYGKDMVMVNGIIRGNLEIALEDIPEAAEIVVVSGKYNNTSTGMEAASYNGLGNATINSTFMRKQEGEKLNVPQKSAQKVIPYVKPSAATTVVATPRPHPQIPQKPIDPKAEHYANQASMRFWERTGAAATNRPSNK
jgi:hypothetical protein